MPINLPTVNTAPLADTFQDQANKINASINALNSQVVILDSSNTGPFNDGNLTLGGNTFVTNLFVSNSIVSTTNTLNLSSNVVISNTVTLTLGSFYLTKANLTFGSVWANTGSLGIGVGTTNVSCNSSTLSFSGTLNLTKSGWSVGNAYANSTTVYADNVIANLVQANSFGGLGFTNITVSGVTANNGSFTTLNVGTVNANNYTGSGFNTIAASNSVSAPLISSTNFSGNGQNITSVLHPTNNLSDVSNATTARTNLGLGTAATFNDGRYQLALGYTPVNPDAVNYLKITNWLYDRNALQRIYFQSSASNLFNAPNVSWVHEFQVNGVGTRWLMTNDGNFYAQGNIIAYWSDERLKEDIEPVPEDEGLRRVLEYRIVDFKWNEKGQKLNSKDETPERGLIAQEVQKINPEAVIENVLGTDENGEPYLTVKESKLIFDLIGAVQAQQKQIQELRDEIDLLRMET